MVREGLSEKEVSEKAMQIPKGRTFQAECRRTSKAGRLGHTWHVAEERGGQCAKKATCDGRSCRVQGGEVQTGRSCMILTKMLRSPDLTVSKQIRHQFYVLMGLHKKLHYLCIFCISFNICINIIF